MTIAESPVRRAVRVVDRDAAQWHTSRWLAWLLLIAPLLVMAGMMALGVVSTSLFHLFLDEDRVVEQLQFVLIFAAAVVFFAAAIRARRAGRQWLPVLYLIVALGSFVTAGEEISWGQRIFGLQTPDVLEPINQQGESNIHNVPIVQRLFNIAELSAGLYGFLIPIVWLSTSARSRLSGRLDPLLVPPFYLGVLFFLPFAYRLARLIFLRAAGERITELGEVPELALYLAVLVMGVATVRALRSSSLGTT